MAPNRLAPPPPPAASSEETTSGSGSDESEEEEGPTPTFPPIVPKNPQPPPQQRVESETSGDEIEEEGGSTESESESDKAPPKPAPETERKVQKRSPSSEAKKPAPFQRAWSAGDEVRILEALVAHRREHGSLPQPGALVASLAGRLDNKGCGRKELSEKVRNLKRRYDTAAKKGAVPVKDHDLQLFNLSKNVWGDRPAGGITATENGNALTCRNGKTAAPRARLGFGEMCELYPHLAEEVKVLEAAQPGMFKRAFERIDDDKAHTLNTKIKKQKLALVKLEMRLGDLKKEVTKTLVELVE